MAGIYIHIPFCKQACSYCNFHFSTQLSRKAEMVDALVNEVQTRKEYLKNEQIESIYFGGGTPSLLSEKELMSLFEVLHKTFEISNKAEITLEANPDDLTTAKLKGLRSTPINRLSIGVQSFFEEDLRFMNRAHSAEEAISSIKNAQDVGFDQLNMDLIFGSPSTTDQMWQANLEQFFDLKIPHLSAYSLTIEEKTALAHRIESGKEKPLDEGRNYRQYLMLQEAIKVNGYEQYELSNYCANENYSKHNTAYWQGKNYLGIGPAAHSYNGKSRQWNVSNNLQYLKAIKEKLKYFEIENLSEIDTYHEYLITSLRTKWGISFEQIETFSEPLKAHFFKQVKKLNFNGLIFSETSLKINSDNLFQSDEVVRDLMIDS